ncbi:hypothetical protein [uncultured Methanospirillum sp.]|uniref:hypothetical protein n=1 Tax=uncultured Methanospirillum sp. TaxID=262503 RepID=UPI0029C8E586|nr:hypothetical protein [uncultured Methanospirillum sp.]
MSRQEYNDNPDFEDEESVWNISIPVSNVYSSISIIYRALKLLLLQPNLFFNKFNSKTLNPWIPVVIIGLLCIINGPYNFITYYSSYTMLGDFDKSNPIFPFYFALIAFYEFLGPLLDLIEYSIFFTVALYYFAKISINHFFRTLTWITYGMVPQFLSFIIFKVWFLITNDIRYSAKMYLMQHYSTTFSSSIVTNNTIFIKELVTLIGLSACSFIIGLGFLFWSAKIWSAGLSSNENLNKNQIRYIMYSVIGIIIAIELYNYISDVVLLQYGRFF